MPELPGKMDSVSAMSLWLCGAEHASKKLCGLSPVVLALFYAGETTEAMVVRLLPALYYISSKSEIPE